MEQESRWKINSLTGFGIYTPTTVRFDAALDLDNIRATPPTGGSTPTSSTRRLLRLRRDPGSPTYLQPVVLDVGHSRYPMDAATGIGTSPTTPGSSTPPSLRHRGRGHQRQRGDGLGRGQRQRRLPRHAQRLQGGDRYTTSCPGTGHQHPHLPPGPPAQGEDHLRGGADEPAGGRRRPARALPLGLRAPPAADRRPGARAQGAEPPGARHDDIAYAWTFTTGDQTGDLVAARLGLKGKGPLALWTRSPRA